MSLFWKMRDGVDIHIDTNIGKRLNLLTNALTALTGESDVADMLSVTGDFEELEKEVETDALKDKTENMVFEDTVDGGLKGILTGGRASGMTPLKKSTSFENDENTLEKQLVIQTKKVNQLRLVLRM